MTQTTGAPTASSSLAGAVIVFFAWLTAGSMFASLLGADGSGSRAHVEAMMLGLLCGDIVAFAVAIAWLRLSDPLIEPRACADRLRAFVGPRGDLLRTLGTYLAFLVLWVPFAFVLVPMLWHALGLEMTPQKHLEYFARFEPTPRAILGLLSLGVVGPLFEEVVFRGLLQGGLRRLLGPGVALWGTALAFGAIHMPDGSYLLLPITLLGLLFGWLRERTGGLRASFLAHALHNSIMLAIVIAAPNLLDRTFQR
ncbi:MAG: type II CAAX endopeptidase family protein [Planctomycetota bacterium]